MEEQNINTQPQTPPAQNTATPPMANQEKLPGAILAFVFGIISSCFFWLGALFIAPGLIPLVFGIIAVIKGPKARKIFAANPTQYIKAHNILALIGMILGIVGIVLTVIYMIVGIIAIAQYA
ncbi:MAG TPA: hypothetical protein PKW80_03090 [Bacteroidales bacterium]|nr:hypothetical protein [Bacteroidales bacterium]